MNKLKKYIYENEDYMQSGGLPDRYKKLGFSGVNQVKNAPQGDSHKKMVVAKKGDKYKLVKFGYRGMEDYTQHKDKDRRKNYLSRSAGIKTKDGKSTANDVFSPNYWSRKKLWNAQTGGQSNNLTIVENGEYVKDNQGKVGKITNIPSHDDNELIIDGESQYVPEGQGGQGTYNVNSVLSATQENRNQSDNTYGRTDEEIKIKPQEALALAEQLNLSIKRPLSSMSPAKLMDKLLESREKLVAKYKNIDKPLNFERQANSFVANVDVLKSIPTPEDIYEFLFQNQEDSKSENNEMYAQTGIQLDPAKKGTFKSAATRYGMSMDALATDAKENPEKYSGILRKKANFYRNFVKQIGGKVDAKDAMGRTYSKNINGTYTLNGTKQRYDWDSKERKFLKINNIPINGLFKAKDVYNAIDIKEGNSYDTEGAIQTFKDIWNKKKTPKNAPYHDELLRNYLGVNNKNKLFQPNSNINPNEFSTKNVLKLKDDAKLLDQIQKHFEKFPEKKVYQTEQDFEGYDYNDMDENQLSLLDLYADFPEHSIGNYKIRKGKDSKGEYVSYYDKWDLKPSKYLPEANIIAGKPFEVYGKKYINSNNKDQSTKEYELPYFVNEDKLTREQIIEKDKTINKYKSYNKDKEWYEKDIRGLFPTRKIEFNQTGGLQKSQQDLVKWTNQKWRTNSGEKSSETGERYLPDEAWDNLSASEKARTNRAKREGGGTGKNVPQPKDIAEKTSNYRKAQYGLDDEMYYKSGGSTVNSAGNYTKPEMRKRLFNRIKGEASMGTAAGQWSARKAQKLAKAYKDNGGGYKQVGGQYIPVNTELPYNQYMEANIPMPGMDLADMRGVRTNREGQFENLSNREYKKISKSISEPTSKDLFKYQVGGNKTVAIKNPLKKYVG